MKPNAKVRLLLTILKRKPNALWRKQSGVYTSSLGNSAAFLPLNEITPLSDTIISSLESQDPQSLYPSGTDSSIISGWKAQRDLLIKYMKQGKIAVGEFINAGVTNIGIVLVKPLSRGSVNINSTDAFDDPAVDFATLRNPLDVDIITEMIRATRKILATPALQALGPTLTSPADNITSNVDLESYIRTNLASSLWHPSGSAAMMKRELGGVVGPDLLVYGTKNLSVVDASIIPICPSTHITSTVYAVAEKVSFLDRSAVI